MTGIINLFGSWYFPISTFISTYLRFFTDFLALPFVTILNQNQFYPTFFFVLLLFMLFVIFLSNDRPAPSLFAIFSSDFFIIFCPRLFSCRFVFSNFYFYCLLVSLIDITLFSSSTGAFSMVFINIFNYGIGLVI
jgi:hypothetical protein